MPVQLNLDWKKIRSEISRLSDLNVLKSEVQKARDEIMKFDLQDFLSPNAQKKVKEFEKRYNKLMKNMGSAQKQMDREFNKLIRQIQKHKSTAQNRIDQLKNLAETQKDKVEKVAKDLNNRVVGTAKKSSSKRASKKTATKRTSLKKTNAKKVVKKTAKKRAPRKKA